MNIKTLFQTIFCLTLVALISSCEKNAVHIKITGKTMGTTYSILLPQLGSEKIDTESLKTSIDQKLVAINKSLSTYIPDSEISKFNQFEKADTWMNISKDMFVVSQKAKEIAILTDYFFDPTLGPLINLWGFGYKDTVGLPKQKDIDDLMPLIGMDKIELAQNIVYQIKKKPAKIQLDYSALAKGYGVDQISALLSEKGYTHHYAEIGGEVVVKGFRDGKKQLWKLGVEKPQINSSKRSIMKTLNLTDMAAATSGDYRNYFIHEGKQYNHTLVPSTGYPSQHTTRSVTVLHKNCMDADAFATGLLAMGHPEAFKLANNLGLAALFIIEKEPGKLMTYTSNYLLELEKKNR